jgi:Glutaminase
MQSISKIISLSFAIEKLGIRKVFKYVGMEPTADSFNSLMRLEMSSPIPANPFMNAGAIVICALLQSSFKADAFDEMAGFAELMTGEKISFNGKVYESERSTADRNKALAHFMKSVGSLPGDVDGFLDLYFRQCSIMCTVRSLAKNRGAAGIGRDIPIDGKARPEEKKPFLPFLG